MRKKLIAGNWKMNGVKADIESLAGAIADLTSSVSVNADILICPPFTLTADIVERVKGTPVAVGVQDVSDAPKAFGAYTGEISAEMVADAGARFAIVGHSERRSLYGETNEIVRAKAVRAMEAGLCAVICVGETLQEREAGQASHVVRAQVRDSVPTQATPEKCVIAYEPVWAIGTGKVPTNADIEEIHAAIRLELAHILGQDNASQMRILYGGSVKPSNALELLGIDNVDGALIGGASLKATDFMAIVETQR